MSKNWMRHFELRLMDGKGEGIRLSDIKITFNIQKMPATVFNGFVGDFKIYNLSEETKNRIMKQEFSRIEVNAGYDGSPDESGGYPDKNVGVIFTGDIRFSVTGKDNITDSWVLIQCIDSWQGHLYAGVHTTVPAGWKYNDVFSHAMGTLEPYGITKGSVPDMPTTVFPRGKVLYGNTTDLLYSISGTCKADFWYENNQVNMVPETKHLDQIVILNANTGLIGMPQQTMGAGVNVRCLINPNIKLGGLVRLDQSSIYRASLSNEQIGMSPARLGEKESDGNIYVDGIPGQSQPASINTDGDYIVGSIDYTGDTRGQNWYMDLLCLAKGSRDLLNSKGLDAAQYT